MKSDNTYEILSKHFLGKTSNTEEEEITHFKKENEREYHVLAEMWNKDEISDIEEYDAEKALKKLKDRFEKNQTKVISISTKIKRIAAIAAILTIGFFSATYFFNNSNSANNTFLSQTNNTEEVKQIVLSDGTEIWLNKNATINYPEEFSANERNIKLKGEAFFDVFKNPNQPFIIETEYADITVLGTSFNVNSSQTGTGVEVKTGKVNVRSNFNEENVNITPGEIAFADKQIIRVNDNLDLNYLAWKTGEFDFIDTDIKQIISDLNTYYQKPIKLEKETEIDCKFTADFKQEKLTDILEILKISCDFTILENDNEFIIQNN